MTESIVFVHGSGRSGRDCWPGQVNVFPDASYLVMPGHGEEPPRATDMTECVSRVLAACGHAAVVVAHSFGAIAAVLAAEQAPRRIRGLVLLEPALYSLARGRDAVDAHVVKMTPVFERAAGQEPGDFWAAFMSALTGAPGRVPGAEPGRSVAERLRLQRPPWEFEISPRVFEAVPALVITGDWNREYEEIAEALEALGARHEVVRGRGHRVQDDSRVNALLAGFFAASDRRHHRQPAGGLPDVSNRAAD